MRKAQRFALPFELGKLVGVIEPLHRQVSQGRTQILADGQQVTTGVS